MVVSSINRKGKKPDETKAKALPQMREPNCTAPAEKRHNVQLLQKLRTERIRVQLHKRGVGTSLSLPAAAGQALNVRLPLCITKEDYAESNDMDTRGGLPGVGSHPGPPSLDTQTARGRAVRRLPWKRHVTSLEELHTYVSDLQATVELRNKAESDSERQRLTTVIDVMERTMEHLVDRLPQ